MEIERKWMVSGWPDLATEALPLIGTEYQEQGYVHTQAPIVRIRLEARIEASTESVGVCTSAKNPSAESAGVCASAKDSSAESDDAFAAAKEISPDGPARSAAADICPGSLTQSVKDSVPDGCSRYIMCFKSAGYLMREEIEIEISKEEFNRLAGLIGKPLIRKVRRIYQLPGELALEVNLVDEGLPTEFMYAEVEYSSEEQARAWDPAACGLGDYLTDDVTEQPGQSMSAFWARTRVLPQAAE